LATSYQQNNKNMKLSISQPKEQYYQSIRKRSTQSAELDNDRIPEYSSDIYPYATFHLKDQDKARSPKQPLSVYECRDTILVHKKYRSNNTVGTEKRRKKKCHTESEEYDSLNSDDSRELQYQMTNCIDELANFPSE
jgi:hypothetical protein